MNYNSTISNSEKIPEILNNSFLKIKKSLEIIFNSPISITSTEFKIQEKEQLVGDYILLTELKGKISGETYLIINQSDANSITHIMNKHFNSKIEKDMCLLELDNILSASAVSTLSESTNKFVYGDVPHLFHQQYKLTNNKICAVGNFYCPNNCINLQFIWALY